MSRFKSLVALPLLASLYVIPGSAENLKLLISVQQQNIVAPNPVRATLHFHNSGRQTLWLYRPVRSEPPGENGSIPPAPGEHALGHIYGGSTLAVHLEAFGPSENNGVKTTGNGFAILPDALPFPRLVRLAPGEDYEEKVNLHLEPAYKDTNHKVWGNYRFSVSYSAAYSNAAALARDIGATLWQGQVNSNSVNLNLQPATAKASIEGTVLGSIGQPLGGALVTLSDDNESAIDQLYTGEDGRFLFTHLSAGRYWLTVRQPGSDHDTSVFRHIDLNEAGARATAEIMMLPVEAYKSDRILHKPVLFRIVDGKGHPLAKIRLETLYSSENVIENVKAKTGDDGFAAVSLIPGSNFVTMQSQGCRKEERRADVAPGPGVDGFRFAFECVKK